MYSVHGIIGETKMPGGAMNTPGAVDLNRRPTMDSLPHPNEKFQVDPTNELQTREWFIAHLSSLPFSVIESRRAYPDYLLQDDGGKMLRTEAEYLSSNFIQHGHNPAECDLVLCWKHDLNLPLSVFELSTREWHESGEGADIDYHEDMIKPKKPSRFPKGVLESCEPEVKRFVAAMAVDLRAYHKWQEYMTEPRMALFKEQENLEGALRSNGGGETLSAWSPLHPYDLFELITGHHVD